jgi:hypothetical protein
MNLSLRKIVSFSSILVIISLFLRENINSIAIILFACLIILLCIERKDYSSLKTSFYVGLPLVLYFVLASIGIMVNKESNIHYLVRLTPFLIAPLFLYYLRLNESKLILLFLFVGLNILFLLFLDVLAIKDMILAKSLFVIEGGRENYRFLYTRFTGGYFNHIYLSTYTLFSIALSLQFKLVKNRFLQLVNISFLFMHIVLLGSRAVVIGILLASILSAIVLTILDKKNIKYLLGLFGVFLLAVSIIYTYKDTLLMNRYAQAFEWVQNRDLLLKRDYSINNRAKLYLIGFSMFQDIERYDINGTGLTNAEIKSKYQSHFTDKFNFKTITYNAHNQYINNFIDWGILGILLLGYLLFMVLKSCFRHKLYWITFFWFSFSIILMMESVLIRHRGIVFFVFFYTLFTYYKPQLKDVEL